jgi:hypothetical protein
MILGDKPLLSEVVLSQYSTGRMQISNDAKLNMTDGTYKDIRGVEPRQP